MKKIVFVFLILYIVLLCAFVSFATSKLDTDIPVPTDVQFGSNCEVTWTISDTGASGRTYVYKNFKVQLYKRYAEYNTGGWYDYVYRSFGSAKTVTVTDNDETEYVALMEISSAGVYEAKVQAYTVEGTYGNWSDFSTEAAFDSTETNIVVNNGSSVSSNYGPGTIYSGLNGMNVQSLYNNNGQANIIGSNGQYINASNQYGTVTNQSGTQYIYDNNYVNNYNMQGQTATVGVGPGYNNGTTSDSLDGPGINGGRGALTNPTSNGQGNIVSSLNVNGSITNASQIVQQGPQSSGGGTNGNWSTEVGWHTDANGFYYYAGNGTYLRNQWYLIGSDYYRFDESGYALIAKWYKEQSNGCWYYLGAQGKMLTGWQMINNVWYYLNPQKGTSYGVMYSDCSMQINGKYYAFDSDGACIMNGTYQGYYYGQDGSRTN